MSRKTPKGALKLKPFTMNSISFDLLDEFNKNEFVVLALLFGSLLFLFYSIVQSRSSWSDLKICNLEANKMLPKFWFLILVASKVVWSCKSGKLTKLLFDWRLEQA